MMRKLMKLSIAGVMMVSIVSVSYAAPKKSTPVILKMNDYYVAYTYPKD
ncbi:hypothetical protein [Bacillus sp. FJAT-28004]|nr:hypothetical protein [Bacillus sp. FJAT-28004]